MTDEQRDEEGEEEAIEDLEAPATTQDDVAGGAACGKPSVLCQAPTWPRRPSPAASTR